MPFEMPFENVIQRVKEAVPGLIAVYRFGSQAQGTARPESDVDLAVLAQQALSPATRLALREDLSLLMRRDVDLIDLRQASTVLRMQVVSTGECLFSADDRRREQFETMVYTSYARLNEERRGILDDIRARGRVYAG
jgi:predicted nucleotidyltransferase